MTVRISIHTPLAGSDEAFRFTLVSLLTFQSTLPLRGVTIGKTSAGDYLEISIHTPLAGSDFSTDTVTQQPQDFNPHSPCGE